MDVVKSTLISSLPVIQDAINQSDFIAIDTELTGLSTSNHSTIDTPQQRYSRLRLATQKFTITQYGVSCFIWDTQSKSYISRPFNFYVFPTTVKFPFNVYERNFLCQIGSIEFLAQNGFNFNKWIGHGIPYCSKENESYIRSQMTALQNNDSDKALDGTTDEFLENHLNQVQEWLQNSTEKSLEFQVQSSYYRKLLIQQIRKKYTTFLAVASTEPNIQVLRLNEEERKQGLGNPTLELEKTLDEYIGFRKVMDMIFQSGKPVVGHNMLLDLTHTYNCFIGALPEKWEDFKKALNKHFPIVYDTKHICKSIPELAPYFPDSSLEKVYTTTNQPPFTAPAITIHPLHSRYAKDVASYHEAGWDAHATGAAFARLVAFFQEKTDSYPRLSLGDDRLMALLNRINIMTSDMAYLHLTGADDEPDRTAILHIYDIPAEWKSKDIESLFDLNEFGTITLNWINNVSSFIKFASSNLAELALAQYKMKKNEEGSKPTYKLQLYADLVRDDPARKPGSGAANGSTSLKRSAPDIPDTPNKQSKVV